MICNQQFGQICCFCFISFCLFFYYTFIRCFILLGPQPPKHPATKFIINNGAGSAAFVLCFYCFNYLFYCYFFYIFYVIYIAPTPAADNILQTNILRSTMWPNTFQFFLFVLTFAKLKISIFLFPGPQFRIGAKSAVRDGMSCLR